MVPNLSKGAGIKGTALYVLHDVRDEGERAIGAELTPDRQTQHRVGMTATRNLSTDNPELAWRLMCATAENREALKAAAGVHKGGRPSKYQCGHLSLSWEHQTRPDHAEMLRAAEGALTALGWEKLQALIVEHRDHDHAHCHIVVNLIDPETGRTAPNAKNDFEKVQRWAHEYDQARGVEACPNRAARMERQPDEPTPPEPPQRWLSRKEYEAVRAAERAEHRTQALDRYREAAAEVREQFRPKWATLYREQRAELRTFDRDAKQRQADLANARRPDELVAFYNQHRELIWRGITPEQRPGNNHTLLTPGFLRSAIERAEHVDRWALTERHGLAKEELQARHTEARQDAYRAATTRPASAEVMPFPGQQPGTETLSTSSRGTIGLAAAVAASAAGIAAYALTRNRNQNGRDPQQDLDRAAERISRQPGRAANANRPQADPESATKASQQPKKSTDTGRSGGGASTKSSELDELRARADARNTEIRLAHEQAAQRSIDRGFDRERQRD